MPPSEVLIVDPDPTAREEIEQTLLLRGIASHGVGTPWEAMAHLADRPCDAVVIEVDLPEIDGIELAKTIGERYPTLMPVLTASRPTIESAAAAVRVGAFDYLMKPTDFVRLANAVRQAIEAKQMLDRDAV